MFVDILLVLLAVYLIGIPITMYHSWKDSGPTDTFMEQLPVGLIWPLFLLICWMWHD